MPKEETEEDKKSHAVIYHPEYADLLDGDVGAALVLSQIVYWYLPSKKTGGSKLRVCITTGGESVWWLAKSHVDWLKELKLTRTYSRIALKILKEKGIIVTEIHRFNGSPTTYLRLSIVNRGNLLLVPPSVEEFKTGVLNKKSISHGSTSIGHSDQSIGPNGTSIGDGDFSIGHCDQSITYTTTGTTTGTTTSTTTVKDCGINPALQEDSNSIKTTREGYSNNSNSNNSIEVLKSKTEEKENCAKEKESKESVVVDAKDILQKAKLVSATKAHTGSLEAHWKSCMNLVVGGSQKVLTKKELGQLGHLRKQLGDTLAREIITFSINNWKEFNFHVYKNFGQEGEYPDIGYLLKYNVVAVNLRLQSIAEEKLKSQKKVLNSDENIVNPKSVCYDTFNNVLGEEDYKPGTHTPEEIANDLAELHALVQAKKNKIK